MIILLYYMFYLVKCRYSRRETEGETNRSVISTADVDLELLSVLGYPIIPSLSPSSLTLFSISFHLLLIFFSSLFSFLIATSIYPHTVLLTHSLSHPLLSPVSQHPAESRRNPSDRLDVLAMLDSLQKVRRLDGDIN